VVQESKESFPKITVFKYLVLTQKETESNWCNIALPATEAYSWPCNYTYTLVFTI